MPRSRLRKLALPLLLLVLMPVLCCGIYWFTQVRDIPFDQQTWLDAPVSSATRLRMYPDLEAHYLVIGMESSQVRELLGEPYYQDHGYMAYKVAGTFFLKILRLSFDNNGRLTGYGLGEP
jgi:hypothetical protein